jgi:hypothetical protein
VSSKPRPEESPLTSPAAGPESLAVNPSRELHRAASAASTPKKFVTALEGETNSLQRALEKLFGVHGASFAVCLHAENSEFFSRANYHDERTALLASLEAMAGLAPEGAMQSMLCVQMLSVHLAATKAALQATRPQDDPATTDIYINRASKLMKLFAQQSELLARLQNKISQQKIVVERVDVNSGGQAILGTITGGSRGGESNGN